jgi:hypothetical protein
MTDQPALPGMDDPTDGPSPLEVAARRTLAALHAAGVLTEQHALPMALVLDLARAVSVGIRTGHASAAAMAAAQLRETYAMLPDLPDAPTADAWGDLVSDLRSAGWQPTDLETELAQVIR